MRTGIYFLCILVPWLSCVPGFQAADPPAVFVVTTTADALAEDDQLSLREALLAANSAAPGPKIIQFNLDENDPGWSEGVWTFAVLQALPVITAANLVIDGFTQSGSRANSATLEMDGHLSVQISGENLVAGGLPGSGLVVQGAACTIRGLCLNRFPEMGLLIQAPDVIVEGCWVGVSTSGMAAMGNGQHGISVQAHRARIGGTNPGQRNLISGNKGHGVHVLGGTEGSWIGGNWIGVNAMGNAKLGNKHGVQLEQSPRNQVGASEAGNFIAGNTGYGVVLTGTTSQTNRIVANRIGVGWQGQALGNGDAGVRTESNPRNNKVGGLENGEGNIIAFNAGDGIYFGSGLNNASWRNSIFSNSQHGIDISTGGVTQNDPGDGDGGSNNAQNFPVLSLAESRGDKVRVVGTLNSNPNKSFSIEVYASRTADPSGFGEGEFFLGSVSTVTAADGNATFESEFAWKNTAARFVTALAIDANGNTSEFSKGIQLNQAPLPMEDVYSMAEDQELTLDVLGNDVDPDGDSLTIAEWGVPQHGSLVPTGGGFIYRPESDWFGEDRFHYRVADDKNNSAIGQVIIQVLPVNDVPRFTPGSNQVVEEDSGPVSTPWASEILPGPANESAQSVQFVISVDRPDLFSQQPALSMEGVLSFAAAANRAGLARITVQLKDSGGTERGGVEISPGRECVVEVVNLNDPPVAGLTGKVNLAADWIIKHDLSGTNDQVIKILSDSTGNMIVGGNTFTDNRPSPFLMKIGKDGKIAWQSLLASRDPAWMNSLWMDAAGNVIMGGSMAHPQQNRNLLMAKCNASGQWLWTQSMNGSGNGDDILLDVTGDGVGAAYGVGHVKRQNMDQVVLKVSPEGLVSWVRYFNGVGNQFDSGTRIQFGDAGIYVAGHSWGASDYDVVLQKFSIGGVLEWQKWLELPGADLFPILRIHPSGGILAAFSTAAIEGQGTDILVAGFDRTGRELWKSRLAGAGKDVDEVTDLQVDGNGQILVSAGMVHQQGQGLDFSVIRLSSQQGQWVLTKTVTGESGGNDGAEAIAVSNLGVFVGGALARSSQDNAFGMLLGDAGRPDLGIEIGDRMLKHDLLSTVCATPTGFGAAGLVTRQNEDIFIAHFGLTSSYQEVNLLEDQATSVTLQAVDPDGDPLTYQVIEIPSHGVLSGVPPALAFHPDADYHGADRFTFRVHDGQATSAVVVVQIRIEPQNDAPRAEPFSVTTMEDTAVSFDLKGFDVDEEVVGFTITRGPANGSIQLQGRRVTYLPSANYYGADTIGYKVTDSRSASAEVNVNLTVTPVDDLPLKVPAPIEDIFAPRGR